MKRWRARILVAGLGLVGPAVRADDLGWRPVRPMADAPAAPVVVPAEPVRAFAPAPPPPSEWQPFGPPVGQAALSAPAIPAIDGMYTEPVFRAATVPLTEMTAAPIPVPPVRTVPAYPVPMNAMPTGGYPVVAEPLAAPQPLPVPPIPRAGDDPTPFNDAPKRSTPPITPGTQTTPLPAPTPVTPPTADSTKIWGGYGTVPAGAVVEGPAEHPVGGPPPPIRHRTFGSEAVTISRDYHFMDGVGSYAGQQTRADRRAEWEAADGPATDRFLLQTEYLLWWVQPAKIPVLATTGTPPSQGFLNQPGTQLLLGPGSFGSTARNGFRIRGGYWFDEHLPGKGIDASFFFLGNQGSSTAFNSNQFPVITRPFFAPNTVPEAGLPGEFGERVAFPGRSTGTLTVDNDSDFWGADVNMKCCICRTCNYQSAWFGGFRFLGLDEGLTITENIIAGQGNLVPPGTAIVVQDAFGVKNRFYGPQIGYSLFRRWGRVSVDGRASLALGVTTQELSIVGSQRVQAPGQQPRFFTGGLLAAGPNLGTFNQSSFGAVPEVTMNLGYQLTPTLRAYVGYNFLYWSSVIRPGDQIDRVVDLSFVPNSEMINGKPIPFSGQARPQATFNESGLWIQGVQFGAELRW